MLPPTRMCGLVPVKFPRLLSRLLENVFGATEVPVHVSRNASLWMEDVPAKSGKKTNSME